MSPDVSAAQEIWVAHKLPLSWVRWTAENAEKIIACFKRDGDVYRFKPVSRQSKAQKFISSREWKDLRAQVIEHYGAVCMRCNSTKNINVDHVKPKSKYPELALDFNNMQVLCWPCNKAKSALDTTDYRKKTG